ncbi:hypothetical protein [Maribacter forsetii]|uniref:hypothetical protein n=1 Tax=Maribacter forsetii TaxID=444515 RepID=UPI000560769E|nr:hypothetical protein [Maribacter forsetii]
MKFKTLAYYSRKKNINLIILFIKDIIAIENKLSPGNLFTPAQTTKFKQVKEASSGAVEFKVKFDNKSIDINANESFNLEQSEMIKSNDYGTNDINTIRKSDIEFIKDSNK